jgi:hypothetical protein
LRELFNGWTAAGTRPEFSVVSGVSTGALIAPFAFLGPAYDVTLREIYTSGIAESLVDQSNIFGMVFGSGLFGNARLPNSSAGMLIRIRSRPSPPSTQGRDLHIVTTNLDSQRTVIWNMGRMAAIGSPEALAGCGGRICPCSLSAGPDRRGSKRTSV